MHRRHLTQHAVEEAENDQLHPCDQVKAAIKTAVIKQLSLNSIQQLSLKSAVILMFFPPLFKQHRCLMIVLWLVCCRLQRCLVVSCKVVGSSWIL